MKSRLSLNVLVMFRLIAENPLLLKNFILWRKKPVKFYNSSDFLTIKILSDVKHRIRSDTHPILRNGYAAILFSLGQYNLCMFNTGTNRKAAHSILLATHKISWDFSLHLGLSVLNMRHSAQVVLAQRRQNGSAQVPKNRMSIATNLVLSTLILRPIVF